MATKAQKQVDKNISKKRAKDKTIEVKTSQSGDIKAIRGILNTKFESEVAQEVKERPVVIIPTGILSMDLVVSNGGLLGGRIIDTYGWEGTGKTLVCMTIAGYIQRCTKIDSNGKEVNRVAAFLDAEGTFSPAFARSTGMNTDKLILVRSNPDKILSGEDYFDVITALLGQGVDYIIVDSCPALVPAQVLVNDTGQGQKATSAQLMSTGLTKITPLVSATGQSLVHFINQKRSKPMTMSWERNEQETGGNALKFYSSYRFEVVKSEDIEKQVLGLDGVLRMKKVGVNSCLRLIKNKTAPIPPNLPSTTYHFDFDVYFEDFKDENGFEYYRGVDVIKDYVDTGVRCGVINQASSWFSYDNIKENGKADLIARIRENPSIMAKIRDDVFSKMKVSVRVPPDEAHVEAAG